MKRLAVLSALAAVMLGQGSAQAQELLSNGNLNSTIQIGDTALYYPEFVDWTFTTDPGSYSPSPISPYVPGAFYTQYAGYPAAFADRLGSGFGMIGTSFEGHYPFEIVGPVDIEIKQTVPGAAGQLYTFLRLGPL